MAVEMEPQDAILPYRDSTATEISDAEGTADGVNGYADSTGEAVDGAYRANRANVGKYITAQGGYVEDVKSEAAAHYKVAKALIEDRFKSLPDIQRNCFWLMTVDLNDFFKLSGVSGITDAGERLAIGCQSVTPPARTTAQIEEYFMGDVQRHAGKTTWAGTMPLTFNEREDGLSLLLFELWSNEVMNMDHRIGLGGSAHISKRGMGKDNGYAKNVYLWKLSYDNKSITGGHVALNAWPQSVNTSQLTYAGAASALTVSITLSLDKWLPVL